MTLARGDGLVDATAADQQAPLRFDRRSATAGLLVKDGLRRRAGALVAPMIRSY